MTTRQTGTWDLNGPIPYDYEEPALRGVSAATRTEFDRQVQSVVGREKSALKEWHSGACAAYEGDFRATVEGDIYQGRYASLVFRFATVGCGGVADQHPRGFTLDLKTQKVVGPGQFASNAMRARDWAIYAAMNRKYERTCNVAPLAREKEAPAWSAWRVSAAGFTPYYRRYAIAEGACADMFATVPWRYVARPRDLDGRRKTGYYMFYSRSCPESSGRPCGFLKIVARGSVVRYYGGIFSDFGWVGVRRGRRGHMAATGGGGGYFETLRFSAKDTTIKPRALGSDWRRVSKKHYVGP